MCNVHSYPHSTCCVTSTLFFPDGVATAAAASASAAANPWPVGKETPCHFCSCSGQPRIPSTYWSFWFQAQPSSATPATSSSSSNVKPAETSTPTSSNFLLDELIEEDGTEEGMREGAEERAIFIGELLLGALSIQSEDSHQSWGFMQIIKWWCPTNRSSCLSCLLNGTVMIRVKTMSTPPNNKKSLQLNWACLYTRELLDRIISLYMLLLSFRSRINWILWADMHLMTLFRGPWDMLPFFSKPVHTFFHNTSFTWNFCTNKLIFLTIIIIWRGWGWVVFHRRVYLHSSFVIVACGCYCNCWQGSGCGVVDKGLKGFPRKSRTKIVFLFLLRVSVRQGRPFPKLSRSPLRTTHRQNRGTAVVLSNSFRSHCVAIQQKNYLS